MTDGHRTSTIPRPAGARSRPEAIEHGPDDSDAGERSGLLKDLTTPIPRAKQIVTDGHGRLIVGLFATVIALAIGAALFVLPVKSWMQQREDLATRQGELDILEIANSRLQKEVDRLQTDDGVREAAREEIDYVPAGEQRVTVLPVGAASTALPAGWPYNLVTSIIVIRQTEAADAAAAAAAAASATTASTAVATTLAPTQP